MANDNDSLDDFLGDLLSPEANKMLLQDKELDSIMQFLSTTPEEKTTQDILAKNTTSSHTCLECGKQFCTIYSLNRHIKSTHEKKHFTCDKCGKVFGYKTSLRRHEKGCLKQDTPSSPIPGPSGIQNCLQHTNPTPVCHHPQKKLHSCSTCGKKFRYPYEVRKHKKSCLASKNQGSITKTTSLQVNHSSPLPGPSHVKNHGHTCITCGKRFRDAYNLRRHQKTCKKTKPKRNTSKIGPEQKSHATGSGSPSRRPANGFTCRQCRERFPNRHLLYIHYMNTHAAQRGGSLQSPPWGNNLPPWDDNQELQNVYQANQSLILRQHERGSVKSVYNFPISNDFTVDDLMERAERVYQQQQRAFRLNVEFGLILINVETGECRYFKPFANQELFQRPIYVSRRRDLLRLRRRLENLNITDYILRQRPDTKWKPLLVTNVNMTLYHLAFPLGCMHLELPDYLKTKRCIVALDMDRKGHAYKDNLCAFRCLAVHLGHHTGELETASRALYDKWRQYCRDHCIPMDDHDFQGISLNDLPHYERCFEINVNVFYLKEDEVSVSVYKSLGKFNDTMNTNLFDCHLSYINNMEAYTKKYQCSVCQKLFPRMCTMGRHQKTCKGVTEYKFSGGFYKKPQTVFDKLEEQGVNVPSKDRLFPWFCVWDMEAMLTPIHADETAKLKWTQEHVPISVSLCSNVEGFEQPHCIVEPNLETLVREMMGYMERIRLKTYQLAIEKFESVFQEIDELLFELSCPQSSDDEDTDDNTDEEEDRTNPNYLILRGNNDSQSENNLLIELIADLRDELDAYCEQLICLGFNSQRYDMNLIKKRLARQMNMHCSKKSFTVKRQNSYSCLSNECFKFLDITQYLAPGLSYAAFLKAFDVTETKGYFPYEWFDGLDKLDDEALPPVDQWYSSLKGVNVLKDGNLTAEENHARLVDVWQAQDMKTFRDYLFYYNNLDVGPFVQAVKNLQKYYFERHIDIFKISISVPGLARYMLFECGRKAGASFALIDGFNQDLYHTIKKNIIGGPSIVFHRHHEKDKTYIRGQKFCQTICGFDANALYLYCLGKDMPTGPFIRRSVENNFKPIKRDRFMLAIYWMDFLNLTHGLNIRHQINEGREKRVGKYPVDGYDKDTHTVYQFHGCYFHGHQCWLTRSVNSEKWKQTREKKQEDTQRISDFIRSRGYRLVELRECQFHSQCRSNTALKSYVVKQRLETPKSPVNENQILEGVRSGKLFGMVEVDIRVPEVWPSHFSHPNMSPYQYFSEMSPIFCTTDVPFETIGDHMQAHVQRFGLSKKPRHLLVGGMKAKKILLATPLLKWYLEHGLEVTKIYQTVEYKPQPCFRDFVRDVSDARRLGDVDPSKAIIADTRKLEGNSAYGPTIMDQEKFQDVVYVQGLGNVMREANTPQFRRSCTLVEEEDYFEVEKAKNTLLMNMPVQIGYFILQYAKLHMLQFYYDFMSEYVDRCNFEYCEMDTDSAYMALSGPDLESIIKPNKLNEYRRNLTGCCNDTEFQAEGHHHCFPRTCCHKHASFDKRTPGLFKLEYQGDNIISLCSKTYIVSRTRTVRASRSTLVAQQLLRKAKKLQKMQFRRPFAIRREKKFSSKGLTKRLIKAPLSIFKHVLNSQTPGVGLNRGFRARNNTVYSYHQQRNGFPYFYCKRKVGDDGVTTSPLDLELCPPERKNEKDDDDQNISDQQLIDILNELMNDQ